ncbi:MAG: cytochrome c oxidase subunit 3 [Myxococcota bacterium]|nr:cytochrome oxidase subunit III [Deltaproteobacteria bacterium]MCP4240973.1 cytochrome oxidase subunit III [bacterium]MDP6074978.1 cytochrome c oxidase subunit 3 [Myxococcota bacterium]MDP6243944.1 cytochrome c oxidase subunit 3 [Myxococcota bacterium]MDP7076263.1 cytochrome c oxidase subunit 3 [Myxococcota bacterium]
MSGRPIATTRSASGMPTGLLAVWWVIVSEIVIFGGLLGSYIMYRLAHDAWTAQAAHTNTWIGAFNTLVLLTSSLFAVLAHRAAEAGDGKKAHHLLWLTFAGGATFLVVKALEWTNEIQHGFTLTSSTFWSFYYTAAGLHALHVLVGIIIIAIVARSAIRNLELHRVELIGVYWHFVDVVWIFLFPLLYIAK